MQAWIPVLSWSLYFWKSVFSFRADSILKWDGVLYQTESFLTACMWMSQRSRDRDNSRRVRTQEKLFADIGHNNTKHFLCPLRSRHPFEFLEIARWELVPRGSFARTWKLSFRPFSRPDWLPLGLPGCHKWNCWKQCSYKIWGFGGGGGGGGGEQNFRRPARWRGY